MLSALGETNEAVRTAHRWGPDRHRNRRSVGRKKKKKKKKKNAIAGMALTAFGVIAVVWAIWLWPRVG